MISLLNGLPLIINRVFPLTNLKINNNSSNFVHPRCTTGREAKFPACVCRPYRRSTNGGIARGKREREKKRKKEKNEGTRLPRRKLTKQVDIKGTRAMQIDQRSHVTRSRSLFFFFFFEIQENLCTILRTISRNLIFEIIDNKQFNPII